MNLIVIAVIENRDIEDKPTFRKQFDKKTPSNVASTSKSKPSDNEATNKDESSKDKGEKKKTAKPETKAKPAANTNMLTFSFEEEQ
jgi:hypothetical protein